MVHGWNLQSIKFSILKRNSWIAIFFLVLAVHLVSIAIENSLIENITKPFLVVVLLLFYSSSGGQSLLRKWIISALVFSWIGDVLLMFQSKNENFFLFGLCAFLLAHIFYIVYFHRLRVMENIRSNAWFLLLVVVYYAALISFLSPYLGEMKLPVRIYGLVISFMFLLALHMRSLRNRAAGGLMILGAAFFVISDSILAINKFYQSFDSAGILIMLTYGLAQLFLVLGALKQESA